MDKKVCTKCKVEKTLDLFTKDSRSISGVTSRCKECTAIYKKEYALLNKEQIAAKKRKYFLDNRDKIKEKRKVYIANNKEKISKSVSAYRDKNIDKITKYQKEWRKNNRRKRSEYEKLKISSNVVYALKCKIRKNILKAFRERGFIKKRSTEDILGCTFEEFKIYIESKFESWMNWDNRGLYNGELNYGWDIDHIIPLNSTNSADDVLRLSHYTNLQPLCSFVNRNIKRNKI